MRAAVTPVVVLTAALAGAALVRTPVDGELVEVAAVRGNDDLPRSAVTAGGQRLVLPSNDASYGCSGQSAQQLAMARLRAVGL